MLEFIDSPVYDKWLQDHKPKHFFICVTPYIKEDAFATLLTGIPVDCDIKLLIRGNTEEFTYNKSSDFAALTHLMDSPRKSTSTIRRLQNLHMKAYFVDHKWLLVTSGNLTRSGFFSNGNAEGGIVTDDPAVIEQFNIYFNKLWNKSEEASSFIPKVKEAIEHYVSSTGGHNENANHKEKKKFVYRPSSTNSQHPTPTNDETSIEQGLLLKDLPKSDTSKLETTLEILNNHGGVLFSKDLGHILRNDYNIREVGIQNSDKESVADGKYGEEASKLGSYLSFLHIEKINNKNQVTITELGRLYLENEEIRTSLLREQLNRKHLFIVLRQVFTSEQIAKMQDNNSAESKALRKFLLENVSNATQQTIKRHMKITRKFLMLLNSD